MDDNKAITIFFISGFLALIVIISTVAYQSGQTERLELQLKIEQEKNKNHERADTTLRYNQDN